MLSYRFARLQDNGTWLVDEFKSRDDDDAVAYGLRNRTANSCELYQGERLLATFDGMAPRHDQIVASINQRATADLVAEAW